MLHHVRSRDWRLLVVVALLYMTQGIPLGLAMEALPAMLRQDGASLQTLAFLPLVGLPWIVKFLWAPLADNRWSTRLGKRRSWIIPMQAMVLACLLMVALLGIDGKTTFLAIGLFAAASLASATQDTATDGLAAENFSGDMLVRANTVQVGGTMIGFFLGGSGSLIAAGLFGRTVGLLAIAGLVAAGLIAILFWKEPPHRPDEASRARASLHRFLRRDGSGHVLAIGLLTAMTASAVFALFKLFLVDQGWPLERIGSVGMAGGMATIVVGCGGGAWLIMRAGVRTVLFGSITFLLIAALLWGMMASGVLRPDLAVALLAIIAGSIGAGGASVSAMTIAMRFAQGDGQAGTDMTAVQSCRDLGEIGASSLGTAVAGSFGFAAAFLGAAVLAALTAVAATRVRTGSTVERHQL